jgi:hypothetical protein
LIVRFQWPTPEAAESAHDHVRYPWVDSSVRHAVALLAPDQATEYIRQVRHQYRSDVRERAHTVLEADLGAGVDAIHDARAGRAMAGAGGGRKRGVGERPDE